MIRSLASAFGSLAMAVIVIRGAVSGAVASDVIGDAVVAMILFAIGGAAAGWVLDTLIRDSVRSRFQSRVDWYRDGWESLNSES